MHMRRGVLVAALVVVIGLLVAAAPALGFVTGLTVDSKATLSGNGTTATVSGTIQCTPEPGNVAFIDAFLIQGKGQQVTFADGFTLVTCDGSVQPWSAIVSLPQGGAWKPGKASLTADASDQDSFLTTQTTVRLTKG
jgi:hypothetical protein